MVPPNPLKLTCSDMKGLGVVLFRDAKDEKVKMSWVWKPSKDGLPWDQLPRLTS